MIIFLSFKKNKMKKIPFLRRNLFPLLAIGFFFTMVNLIFYLVASFRHENCPQENQNSSPPPKPIFFITPTYARPVQQPELIRLAQTLLHDRNMHWILVEDSPKKTALVGELLRRIARKKRHQFTYTHLATETPAEFKTSLDDPNWLKPRGVWQRNAALGWLREQYSGPDIGVVYFGDDDNTYDTELFDEIRKTRLVSVFPVGLVGGLLVEKPLVRHGQVVGFNSVWKKTHRQYPIDMSAFAVDLSLIRTKRKEAWFSEHVPRGFQETHLLTQLITGWHQLEPLANQCSDIFVWHTRTENPKLNKKKKNRKVSSSTTTSSNQLQKP